MEIYAEKAVSKAGKPFTKVTALLENYREPSNPKALFANMSEEAKAQFASYATEDENGRLGMIVDDYASEYRVSSETVSTPKGTWVAIRIYFKSIVPGEKSERADRKDIFELREEIEEEE